ncbi:hypothetical protein [Cellulomonas sp. KRMCY2]|uniref:hypothetical protein n=1 Tax=Cellulomonas sp. KRMCY2 TaxID=1304865 RepID=UPI0012DC88ED|nr:hypothetical protein [Cellulomonas sp. KRMCY2]
MNNDTDLTALRALDAAPHVEPDDTARRHAAARLHQILAGEPGSPGPRPAPAPTGRARRLRWVAIPVAVAAVAVTWVIPELTVTDAAYASWTPEPEAISAADSAVADAACRDAGLEMDSPALALVERRGDWVGLLYTSDEPMAATCLAHLPAGGDHADQLDIAAAGGQGAVPVDGQFTQGPIFQHGPGTFDLRQRPTVSFTLGDVGDDVTAVTIGTADGQTVYATVGDGRYLAWWPGLAFGDELEGNGGPAPDLTYTVTLKDGTVINDAEPTRPE